MSTLIWNVTEWINLSYLAYAYTLINSNTDSLIKQIKSLLKKCEKKLFFKKLKW